MGAPRREKASTPRRGTPASWPTGAVRQGSYRRGAGRVTFPARRAARPPRGRGRMDVRVGGRRVLVAEDEFVIALEIGDTLRRAGYEVVGPAATAGEAARLAAEGPLDAAVLDLGLRDGTAIAAADALAARGVPFVFLSGYGRRPAGPPPRPHGPGQALHGGAAAGGAGGGGAGAAGAGAGVRALGARGPARGRGSPALGRGRGGAAGRGGAGPAAAPRVTDRRDGRWSRLRVSPGGVAAQPEPAAGVPGGDRGERRVEGGLQGLLRAGADRPQPGLELGPGCTPACGSWTPPSRAGSSPSWTIPTRSTSTMARFRTSGPP